MQVDELTKAQSKMAASPPRTKPLVAIAEVDRPVMVVTTVAIRMTAMVSPVAHEQNK